MGALIIHCILIKTHGGTQTVYRGQFYSTLKENLFSRLKINSAMFIVIYTLLTFNISNQLM